MIHFLQSLVAGERTKLLRRKRRQLRILIVAEQWSPLTAKWINGIADQGWDVHLFPLNDLPPHPDLRRVTLYGFHVQRPSGMSRSVRIRQMWPLPFLGGWVAKKLQKRLGRWGERKACLALAIRLLQPDFVHSLNIVIAGTETAQARAVFSEEYPDLPFPRWLVSDWRQQLSEFGREPDAIPWLRLVLQNCDYFESDEPGAADTARALGFAGRMLSLEGPDDRAVSAEVVHPAQVKLTRQPGRASARRLIALNGFQSWSGRALVGLRALERCSDALDGYRLGVYFSGLSPHADEDVTLAADLFSRTTGIPVQLARRGGEPSDDVLWLQGGARISIGLSLDDASIPSLQQAMYMGAFPIYSNTGSAGEWIRDGVTGILVHPDEPESVEQAIRHALADDRLVDEAADQNIRLISGQIRTGPPPEVLLYGQVIGDFVNKAG
jgi:hypothetical protein